MGEYFAIDSLGEAFGKTISFFKGPGLLGKWLRLALLVIVFSMLSGGGGGNFNFNAGLSPDEMGSLSNISFQLPAIQFELVVAIVLIAFAALFIAGIILTFIKNLCFFSILESLSLNRVEILKYLKKFPGLSLSLTLFETVLGILGLPFSTAVLIAISGIVMLFIPLNYNYIFANNPWLISFHNFVTNPVVIIASAITGLLGIIVFLIIGYIKSVFAAYIMYREKRGAWESFKKGFSLAKNSLMQVFMLILVQIMLAIVIGIAFLIVMLVVFIVAFLILIIPAIIVIAAAAAMPTLVLPLILIGIVVLFVIFAVLEIIALPLSAFCFYFGLIVVGKFLARKSN